MKPVLSPERKRRSLMSAGDLPKTTRRHSSRLPAIPPTLPCLRYTQSPPRRSCQIGRVRTQRETLHAAGPGRGALIISRRP